LKSVAMNCNAANIQELKNQFFLFATSIKKVLNVSKDLASGQGQCEDAMTTLEEAMETTLATSMLVIVGEAKQGQTNYQECKNQLSAILKDIAQTMQNFNPNDTSTPIPSVTVITGCLPRLSGTVYYLSLSYDSPLVQFETFSKLRDLLSAMYFFVKTLRDVKLGQQNKDTLSNSVKLVQSTLVELAGHLKKIEAGLQDCDAAMNAIATALPLIGTPGQPDPRINNLKQCQDAINNTTREIATTLSNMSKALKANPEASIASFSKIFGQSVVELINFTRLACNIIPSPVLAQNLSFNTKEAAIALGNTLQFTKNALLNVKDPNLQQTMQQSFQNAASVLSKLVVVQKEFNALK